MLSHPETARRGNLLAAGGMFLAIFGTIFLYEDLDTGERLHNYGWIFSGLMIGGVIGTLVAKKVKMTAMPEMVSLFNGMGGACAALISIAEFNHFASSNFAYHIIQEFPGENTVDMESFELPLQTATMLTIFLGLIIGSVSFAGSIIAWGKLNGRIKDLSFKGQHIANLAVLALIIGLSVFLLSTISSSFEINNGQLTNTARRISIRGLHITLTTSVFVLFYLVFFLSLVYGVLFVLPIGGADMPVVISLLNSFTGVAAACGGFLYDNKVMLTGGILVGAAGTLLTILMCKAMNRSLANVLIGSFGGTKAGVAGTTKEQGHYKEVNLTDAAVVLAYANKVMIVPGYGLAVAQAQHACHELEKLLNERGVEVKYAIHPVAGRMPGHMNVLLAEADVSYDKLLEMEQANEEFPTTDVVLILGANDVVNPAAKSDPASPIYGMPILDVEQAKSVIVNKRSMKPGYAGIENDLFFRPKTSMLFGDAKKVLQDLIAEIKNL
jgi:NAD(P) transhydrogenase subunit beta